MKHIIYSILLSVGCLIIPFETVFADADPPECMSFGTNFWFCANGSGERPFKDFYETASDSDWATAYGDGSNPTNVWRDEFISEISIYSTLRLMDWGNTNFSAQSTWSNRTPPTVNQFNRGSWTNGQPGVSYEWMIELCNHTKSDLWVCIPHEANDEYMTNLATLIRDNLDTDLKVYVEYSNEIWNFVDHPIKDENGVIIGWKLDGQGTYVENTIGNSITNLIDDLPNHTNPFYRRMYAQAYRSVQMWERWQSVFGGQFSTRVRKIIAGKSTESNFGQILLDGLNSNRLNPNGIMPDAYAIAPYFGKGPWELPDSHIPMQDLYGNIDNEIVPHVQANYAIWTEGAGIDLVAYEGGIHTDNRTNNLELNRHSDIHDVYLHYLNAMSEYITLFNHYAHTARYKPKETWGAKEFTGQPESEAHKYRALKEWRNSTSCEAGTPGNGGNPGGGDCPLDLTVTGNYPASQIQAANTVDCRATIGNGENVVCNAGTLITLGDKFHAVSGSTFHAFIDECTPEPPSQGDCELLANSSFDSNISASDWGQWGASISVNGSVASITGITTSSGTGGAGIGQNNLTFKTDKTYTLSFKAQSNNRDVTLKVFKNGGDYKTYINETISLTNSMGSESFTFTMSDPEITNGAVQLQFGNNGAHISVDLLSLVEGNCGTTTPPSGGGCELVSNGTFDNTSGWSNWSCTFSASNNKATVTGIATGVEGASGISFSGLEIENGESYTLSFDAESYGNRTMKARVYTGAPSYKSYGEEVNLSTGGMKPYVINFTADASSSNASVDFLLGTSSTGVFIDNVKLNGPCSNKEDASLAPDIQLYPNPATHTIHVEYELPQSTSANITVFDAFGKLVKTVADVELLAGTQTLNMDISDLAAGMYFYSLQASEWKATKKFIIVK